MAKVKDNVTGEVFDVPDEKLGSYGLSAPTSLQPGSTGMDVGSATAPTPVPPNGSTGTGTPPATGNGMGISDATKSPQPTVPAAPPAPDYAGMRAQRSSDLQRDLTENGGKHKDAINAYYDSLLPSQPELAAAKKQQTALDTYGKTKGAVQNLLDTYQGLPGLEKGNPLSGFISDHLPTQAAEYDAQRKGLAATLKDLAGAGAGSGVRTNQVEMANWANLVPTPSKTTGQNQIDLISLDKQLKNTFGQGLDDKYLKTFGISVDDKGNYTKGAADHVPVVNRLVGGAVKDTGDVIKGVASIPGQYVEGALHGKTPEQVTGDLAIKAGKGMVDEYGNLIGAKTANGQPILDPNKSVFQPGGVNVPTSIDAKSAVNHAIDHPVNTALDLIPLAKGAAALKDAGAVGEAGNAATKTGTGLSTTDAIASKPNVAQNLVRNTADLVNGGGSKQYIKNEANNPNMTPQNQVLMDEGILAHPTETGRIQATANSMKAVGTQLASAYEGSDRVFKGSSLGDTLDSKLSAMGYDPKAINMIKTYVGKQGNFDLNSGDNLLTMDNAWKIAQKLEQNPPKILGTPESASALKKLSLDTAGVIRGELANKVPETLPLNTKYGALRDYYDNRLGDPEGLNIAHGHGGGVINTVLNGAKSVINPVLQGTYSGAGKVGDMMPGSGNGVTLADGTAPTSEASAGTNGQTIKFDGRTAQGNVQPTKGSQQLLAATSPSYLKKIAKR